MVLAGSGRDLSSLPLALQMAVKDNRVGRCNTVHLEHTCTKVSYVFILLKGIVVQVLVCSV